MSHKGSASVLRFLLLGVFALTLSCAPSLLSRVIAAASDAVQVHLDATRIQPRPLEQLTGQSIVKMYSSAWKNMETALAENRPELIDESFVGYARDRLLIEVEQQRRNGLSTRYIDHGHQVLATFYSPEGSAVQLQDTAQLEIQVFEGDKVVSSQKVARKYIAVVTVVEDRWKVRVLDGANQF